MIRLLRDESTCTCLYPSCCPEGTHCLFCGHLWPRHQIGGRRRGQHYKSDEPRMWIAGWDGTTMQVVMELQEPLP